MARFRIRALALVAVVTAGIAAAGGTAKQKPLLFTVEVSGSQSVTWALDEEQPHDEDACRDRVTGEYYSQTWIVPVRGSGRLRYTFAGRERNVQGQSVHLKPPTHGTIQGTFGMYWSEGHWDPFDICGLGPPDQADVIAPTGDCGAFRSTGSFDVAWRSGKLTLDAGWKRLYEGDCPLDTDWRMKKGILGANDKSATVPLSAEELRSGETISRTKTTTARVSAPTSWGAYSGEAVNTWTVRLIPSGKGLRAVPKAAPVYRGGRVTLDGSHSRGEITSYRWKLARASGCPEDVKLSSETLSGATVSFTALCPFKATLTVSDGEDTDSASITVAVNPRPWRTPFSSAADGVLNTRLVDGFLQLGRNVCAYDGLTGEQTSGHILHRSGAGGDHDPKGGFTVAEVKSGPFEGNFYIAEYTAKIRRAALVSKDFAGTSDLYAANSDTGHLSDFLALHASVVDHEHLHTTLIQEYVRKSDRAKRIEAMVEADEDALSDRVNVALVEFETNLTEATSDAKVKARMAARWNRSATVMLRDGAGGFVSHTFPSLAELGDGDEGVE